jgi:hypothetical protein
VGVAGDPCERALNSPELWASNFPSFIVPPDLPGHALEDQAARISADDVSPLWHRGCGGGAR